MQCDDIIRARVPKNLASAVQAVAAAKYLSASAYIRQAVAGQLERDGCFTNRGWVFKSETAKPNNGGQS